MTSVLERSAGAGPFLIQTVRVGDQLVDLTAQRTTCPDLVITPRVDASELGSVRFIDGLVLVHRYTGTMIAAGPAEPLHDLAERLSTADWNCTADGVAELVHCLSTALARTQVVRHEHPGLGQGNCDVVFIGFRSSARGHRGTGSEPGVPTAAPTYVPGHRHRRRSTSSRRSQ